VDHDTAEADRNAPKAEPLTHYYEHLADRYDADRFGNSYGRYIDAQERRLLRRWLPSSQQGAILDLACGTGRLLDLASHGLDPSAAMVRIAQRRHPRKIIRCAPAGNIAEFSVCFDAIFCLHLFMHLPPEEIAGLVTAASERLRPGGMLIFDVPSAFRRKLTGFRPAGWHAGTALSPSQVAALAGPRWRVTGMRGILFFPIHRLPSKFRPAFRPLDDLLGLTPLMPLCSYLFYRLERPT
jgi:SAM-dependent methyltransferase